MQVLSEAENAPIAYQIADAPQTLQKRPSHGPDGHVKAFSRDYHKIVANIGQKMTRKSGRYKMNG